MSSFGFGDMAQALPVDGPPNFAEPPVDGEEYLRRVRWEANKLDNVVVSAINPREFDEYQTVYMPKTEQMEACKPSLLPRSTWEDNMLAAFAELQQRLRCLQSRPIPPPPTNIPPVSRLDLWESLCFGTNSGTVTPMPPLLSIVMNLDEVSCSQLLCSHIRWLSQNKVMTFSRAAWLYALLARLEKPLDADMCSALRDLLRFCCSLRSQLEGPTDPCLPPCNIFITLVVHYFKQANVEETSTPTKEPHVLNTNNGEGSVHDVE